MQSTGDGLADNGSETRTPVTREKRKWRLIIALTSVVICIALVIATLSYIPVIGLLTFSDGPVSDFTYKSAGFLWGSSDARSGVDVEISSSKRIYDVSEPIVIDVKWSARAHGSGRSVGVSLEDSKLFKSFDVVVEQSLFEFDVVNHGDTIHGQTKVTLIRKSTDYIGGGLEVGGHISVRVKGFNDSNSACMVFVGDDNVTVLGTRDYSHNNDTHRCFQTLLLWQLKNGKVGLSDYNKRLKLYGRNGLIIGVFAEGENYTLYYGVGGRGKGAKKITLSYFPFDCDPADAKWWQNYDNLKTEVLRILYENGKYTQEEYLFELGYISNFGVITAFSSMVPR